MAESRPAASAAFAAVCSSAATTGLAVRSVSRPPRRTAASAPSTSILMKWGRGTTPVATRSSSRRCSTRSVRNRRMTGISTTLTPDRYACPLLCPALLARRTAVPLVFAQGQGVDVDHGALLVLGHMELKQPHVVRDGFEGVDRALCADARPPR